MKDTIHNDHSNDDQNEKLTDKDLQKVTENSGEEIIEQEEQADTGSEANETPEKEKESADIEGLKNELTDDDREDEADPKETVSVASEAEKDEATSGDSPDDDESEDQEKKDEAAIDYTTYTSEELVKALESLLNTVPIEKLGKTPSVILDAFNSRHEAEIIEKKKNFIAGGGLEQDFRPAEDPIHRKLNELMNRYRDMRSAFNKKLDEQKEINLATKLEVLEEFRILMEGQDSFDSTFRKFKQLQTRWFEVGVVPKQNVKDLWNSYNFFVDKFNDYVKINKELRALDLKKNLELKLELINRAEDLAKDKNAINAFKRLQKLHTRWREIGPVPWDDRDAIWERFKEATSVINKAHQNFQSELKDSLVENLELKKALCEKVEELAAQTYTEHKDWVGGTKRLLDIQKEWKTIGYAPKKDNSIIYARFRKARDQFFEKKASFYAETFEHQKENLEKKKQIVADSEEIKDSTDWKNTTNRLIELQKQWKEIGPVPRKDSDRLWKRFRGACDHFFSKKSEFYGGSNEAYAENLKAKEELIEEMKKYSAGDDDSQVIKDLEQFQDRFNEIGFVPVESKDKIREDFREVQNNVISSLSIDEHQKSTIRYRLKIKGIIANPKAENKLNFEREKLITKLQQLRNDLSVLENNIGFFKQTKSSEDTLSDYNERITDTKERIITLEKRIQIIDKMEEEL
ncbi:DUF349 domain-containing protein [Bacteroidota bacterium]